MAGVLLLGPAAQAGAAGRPVSDPRIIAHLDFSRGQTPENVALEPDGSADVTLAVAAQVAQVSRSGAVRVLAQLARPAGGAACPVLGSLLGATALTVGITRDHGGSLYVALCTGSPDLQGIWRISRSGSMARVAALPADGIPNGIALDQRHGVIYVADSLLSTVWRVTVASGAVSAWASGAQLAPDGGLGANGLKLHGGAIWVSNTQLGTLLRIPVRRDGFAGPIQTKATGLSGIDDFAFTGRGNRAPILAAINRFNRVVLIQHDGRADGTHGRGRPVESLLHRHPRPHCVRAQRRLPNPHRSQRDDRPAEQIDATPALQQAPSRARPCPAQEARDDGPRPPRQSSQPETRHSRARVPRWRWSS